MSLARTFPARAAHLDFHTMPGVYDVGSRFQPPEFADTLASAGVQFVTVFAKCNIGFAYYPTRLGIVHPGLKTDLLGGMVTACHQRHIKVAAYFNVGLDHEQALRQRAWCKLNREGQIYDLRKKGHWFRRMCLNTGYGDYLLSLIREVLTNYPVDGIFLDGLDTEVCYGVECLKGLDKAARESGEEGPLKVLAETTSRLFLERVESLVRKSPRELTFFANGRPYREQPTHIELEVLPNGEWGYDYLPWLLRYAATLSKPYVTMTGRFHKSWRDFGGLRPEHSLLFDCYTSISCGGTCSVGDHLHPRGRLEPDVYSLVGKVYARVKKLEPWTVGAVPEAEIAVLDPALRACPSFLNFAHVPDIVRSLAGASRMLSELKQPFAVTDGGNDLTPYRVIILPDNVALDTVLAGKLRRHLASGGAIISSAFSGLDAERKKFVLPEYRFLCAGPEPHHYSFFTPEKEVAAGLPAMPVTIYHPGISLVTGKNSRVLARLHKPYFNQQSWDGYHENLYIPPEKEAGRPALARSGNIFHFSFPIFSGYYRDAVVPYRTLLRNCLEQIMPEPLVKVEGMPSFGRVTVTRQGRKRMVHLLTYLPELRGKQLQIIEEPVVVRDVKVSLRNDAGRMRRAYLAPERRSLNGEKAGRYFTTVVPEISGYRMLVIE